MNEVCILFCLFFCCVRRSKRQPASSLLHVLILKENQNERHESQGEEAGGVEEGGGRFREEKFLLPFFSLSTASLVNPRQIPVEWGSCSCCRWATSSSSSSFPGVETDFSSEQHMKRTHINSNQISSWISDRKRDSYFFERREKEFFSPSSSLSVQTSFLPSLFTLYSSKSTAWINRGIWREAGVWQKLFQSCSSWTSTIFNVNHISIYWFPLGLCLSQEQISLCPSTWLSFYQWPVISYCSFPSSKTRELHQWRYFSRLNSISHESTV